MPTNHQLLKNKVSTENIVEVVGRLQPKTSQSRRTTTALQVKAYAISGIALGLAFGLLMGGKAEATTFRFKKIADTNTRIPGSTGKFTSFGYPALDEGMVAFRGISASQDGIYTKVSDALNVVADRNTPIPGANRTLFPFETFEGPSLDDGIVVFSFSSAITPHPDYVTDGIYTNAGGSLNVVVDTTTPALIPPSLGTMGVSASFQYFWAPSISNGNIAFISQFQGVTGAKASTGIFTNTEGSLKLVAGAYGAYGGCYFLSRELGFPSFENGIVAFAAFSLCSSHPDVKDAIFTSTGIGSYQEVASNSTSVPSNTGNFTTFSGAPSLSKGDVAFLGFSSSGSGIYKKVGDSLTVVADTNTPIPGGSGNFTSFGGSLTPIPGGSGNFTSFGGLSLDNSNVAFQGVGSIDQGIYITIGGSLTKILAKNDSFKGKTVNTVALGQEALSGNQLAFTVLFTDGSQGIYLATLKRGN